MCPASTCDVGGGRLLHVPKSLKGVAVFSFKKLCGEAGAGLSGHRAALPRHHSGRYQAHGPGHAQWPPAS
jgi:cell division protein ZapE